MPSTPTNSGTSAQQPPRSDAPADAKATTPAGTGTGTGGAANTGSPAAPVMKQFAKTEAESRGNRK